MTLTLSRTYPLRRAFITGAASGLGRALALLLAADGWTIGVADLDATRLTEATEAIRVAGGHPIPFTLDVASHAAYVPVAAAFLAQVGGLDLLINNAGVGDGEMFVDYQLDNFEWVLGINQMGVLYGCHLFVPTLVRQRSGHLINVASAAAFGSAPGMAAYSMSKAAVLSLSETLYAEMLDHQVRVSVVMPYFFQTNIMAHSRGRAQATAVGNHLVAASGLSADTVARAVLTQAGNNRLYIVEPFIARAIWWLKRLFPRFTLNQAAREQRKNLASQQARLDARQVNQREAAT